MMAFINATFDWIQAMSQTESAIRRSPAVSSLSGSVLVLIQFDVCEEIRLDELRQAIGARTLQQPGTRHLAPSYVRYQRPSVAEAIEPLLLDSGERLTGEIKYYDYGVTSLIFQLSFSGDWESLVHLASHWVWDIDFASLAEPIVRKKLYKLAAAGVGVPGYKDLVAQKLRTAEELYRYMIEQFNQSRAFFLEATVVLILLIELFFFFRSPTF